MTKKIHFESKLIPLILSGQKTATWRIDDDKDLTEGDLLELLESDTEKLIGKVKIVKVFQKAFKDLTEEDKEGHESYSSEEEMFQTFSGYYDKKITPETIVKIAHFEFIK